MVDLSAPVDVYADWVDACDAVAKDAAASNTALQKSINRTGGMPRAADNEDDFVVQDEVDAEGDYDE